MQTAIAHKQVNIYREFLANRLGDCLVKTESKTRSGWIVEQLSIEPYQRILEVGYGMGNTLAKVGKKLKTGFLAGVDESVVMYQMAQRKNKKLLEQELLQLHIGELADLPYPPYYFDKVYVNNIHSSWKNPQQQLLQITRMLKVGGSLLMVFQPAGAKTEDDLWVAAENLRQEYKEAGLVDIRISFMEMQPVHAVSVLGIKP